MELLLAKLMTYLPFLMAFAEDEGNFISGIVGWVAGIGGGIIAIFIIVSLVKDGFEFSKGQGNSSIWKIIGKVLFLLIILGLIYLAVNYESLGQRAQNVGEDALNIIEDEVDTMLE